MIFTYFCAYYWLCCANTRFPKYGQKMVGLNFTQWSGLGGFSPKEGWVDFHPKLGAWVYSHPRGWVGCKTHQWWLVGFSPNVVMLKHSLTHYNQIIINIYLFICNDSRFWLSVLTCPGQIQSGEKYYVHYQCETSFTYFGNLKKHVWVHSLVIVINVERVALNLVAWRHRHRLTIEGNLYL